MRFLALVALALCVGCRAQQVTLNIEWSEGPKLPMALGSHAAMVDEGKLIVVGGTNWTDGTKIWNDRAWVLDQMWKEQSKLPIGIAPNCAGNILAGGYAKQGAASEAFRYAGGSFQKISDLPEPRALAGGAGEFIIGGTPDPTDLVKSTASVVKFNHDRWEQVAPLPTARSMMATCKVDDSIFIFGGMDAKDSAEALRYDIRKNAWSKIADLPGARRGAAAVAIDDRFILVVGGCRNEPAGPLMLDEALLYDIAENRYRACEKVPYAAACQAAVMHDGKIYVTGGEDKPKSRTDRVVIGKLVRTVQ